MLNKVMLSTESRMRGNMQVRFGGRYGKTYRRKAARRPVPSLRLGKGGNILALAAELHASSDVAYLLRQIEGRTPHVRQPSATAGSRYREEPAFRHLATLPLTSPALLDYLRERGIGGETARKECREIRYECRGKRYYAVGFPNIAGGFELRNRYFKGCVSPKAISVIRGGEGKTEVCCLFEGFMDYLSFLMLREEPSFRLPGDGRTVLY